MGGLSACRVLGLGQCRVIDADVAEWDVGDHHVVGTLFVLGKFFETLYVDLCGGIECG